ncbi:hypothetical protein CEE45_12060 [Candidatus Heimdallarchaeota archaeon B3_Heim]|nr:MAG: hypothetical protein CEE45_12060 [Candidatus Heimdallarchaeota archaeon B3_Heim]
MDFLNEMIPSILAAVIAVISVYGIAHWLQIQNFQKTRLKLQLYQSGETILPRRRRYLDKTFIWISYFTTSHVISFMFATLLVLSLVTTINIFYPLLYFVITSYAIFMLAIRTPMT